VVSVEDQSYELTRDAVLELVWCMFFEDDVPTIYGMLTELAELDNIGSEEIYQAWAAFHQLRAAIDFGHSDGLR
jgi:hypothetical protein